MDLPLLGRKFTWYKPCSSIMSRIDRFLLSDRWIQQFGNLIQWGAKRTISDHCPSILKGGESNWGPKPFRVLDYWNEHPEFRPFVQERWGANQINGTSCYVLKEKLKGLKSDLKEWTRTVFGNIYRNIEMTTKTLNKLDLEAESRVLTTAKEESRKSLTSLLWQRKKAKESLLCQKSRFKWLQRGDSNSCLFQKMYSGQESAELHKRTQS